MSTSAFITIDGIASREMCDALRARGILLHGTQADVDLFAGDLDEHPAEVDAWFADLPWGGDDNACLVAYGQVVMVTSVIVDGELVSTTTAHPEGVEVDDFLEDAA